MYNFIYQIFLFLFISTLMQPCERTDSVVPPQVIAILLSLLERSIPHGVVLPVALLIFW